MTLFSFIKKAIKSIDRRVKFHCQQQQLTRMINERGRKAFLFGSPGHGNMGDQAQTYCIEQWIKENYADDYEIITMTLASATDTVIYTISQQISANDLLFCHSGYHLTDLYNEKDVYLKVIEQFPKHRIVIFPQTINFNNNKEDEKRVSLIFNSHKNITLLCRDQESYKNAQLIFKSCNLLLYPDIVTSLIGTKTFSNRREGVLFCMRNDVEAFYTVREISKLRARFDTVKTEMTDTTISTPYKTIKRKRETILNEMLNHFSQFELVITDRYHGTIFSLIAGTPVIVLSSTDHKLSSGVKWFPESFGKNVQYAKDPETAYLLAIDILANHQSGKDLPAYFKENYYDVLKSKIKAVQ